RFTGSPLFKQSLRQLGKACGEAGVPLDRLAKCLFSLDGLARFQMRVSQLAPAVDQRWVDLTGAAGGIQRAAVATRIQTLGQNRMANRQVRPLVDRSPRVSHSLLRLALVQRIARGRERPQRR